ncbi:MAG: immunoglobulin domain-containing protein [Phycisphaerae bacterium]
MRSQPFASNLTMAAVGVALSGAPSALAQCTPITASQTEGPYYRTPNPETDNMRQSGDTDLLTITGQVVDTNCNPIPYVWLAWWHTDIAGVYDNAAPFDRYRCTQFTDAEGHFALDTIYPGLYPGRTRHVHVKVDSANSAVLTTQLYFAGDPQNAGDGFYSPALAMNITIQPDGVRLGTFQFRQTRTAACSVPALSTEPGDVIAAQGETVTFAVAATGTLPMTFAWHKNGEPLQNDARISGVTTNTLRISGATCADAGSYTCSALSSCGTDSTSGAELSIVGCCVGDIDGDGAIGLTDLAILLTNFGTTGGATPAQGDLDDDTDVDLTDLATLLTPFGSVCP